MVNVGLTLVQRLRRWNNIKSTLIQRLVSAGGCVAEQYNIEAHWVIVGPASQTMDQH